MQTKGCVVEPCWRIGLGWDQSNKAVILLGASPGPSVVSLRLVGNTEIFLEYFMVVPP